VRGRQCVKGVCHVVSASTIRAKPLIENKTVSQKPYEDLGTRKRRQPAPWMIVVDGVGGNLVAALTYGSPNSVSHRNRL
jgi:hypothetical protein